MDDQKKYLDQVTDELAALRQVLEEFNREEARTLVEMANIIASSIEAGNVVFTCGNGGSAADSQHIAGELVGRFRRKKLHGYKAFALTTNSSIVTALANDYSFDDVFSKQIEAIGSPGDVLLILSTSGNSANVVEAARTAGQRGMTSLAFSGAGGGRLADKADLTLTVREDDFARIQEIHMTLGHILCGLVEEMLTSRSRD
jgi:D-sedoheptulose 7-phosphate isomerase